MACQGTCSLHSIASIFGNAEISDFLSQKKVRESFRKCVRRTVEFVHLASKKKCKNPSSHSCFLDSPPIGWTKLNTDGSALGNTSLAGTGGLLWDSQAQ